MCMYVCQDFFWNANTSPDLLLGNNNRKYWKRMFRCVIYIQENESFLTIWVWLFDTLGGKLHVSMMSVAVQNCAFLLLWAGRLLSLGKRFQQWCNWILPPPSNSKLCVCINQFIVSTRIICSVHVRMTQLYS